MCDERIFYPQNVCILKTTVSKLEETDFLFILEKYTLY